MTVLFSYGWVMQAPLVYWAEQMGSNRPPCSPLSIHLCPVGMWSKRRHWALFFFSQQLHRVIKLFLVAVSKKKKIKKKLYWPFGLWLRSILQECFILISSLLMGCFQSIQWLKSHIFKFNYRLSSILTQYIFSALHLPHSVFLHLLSEISKEAQFVNRSMTAL